MNEKLYDKVKKLLALSHSTNEHEAENALRRATNIMAMHKISVDDVTENPKLVIHVFYSDYFRFPTWVLSLYNGIANAFGCFMIYVQGSSYDGTKAKLNITGRQADIDKVLATMLEAYPCIFQLSDDYAQSFCFPLSKSERSDYRAGLARGYTNLLKKIYAQAEEEYSKSTGTSLIPIDTRLADAENFFRQSNHLKTRTRTFYRSSHYGAGIKDAHKVERKKLTKT